MKNSLEASVQIDADLATVWNAWTDSERIKIWNVPFSDWHCPYVLNNIKTNGEFHFRMEKLDGSEGFDYKGIYLHVDPLSRILILQDDGRKTEVTFENNGNHVVITERFEPEETTDLELQLEFCQSVLNKFKSFVEEGS